MYFYYKYFEKLEDKIQTLKNYMLFSQWGDTFINKLV